MWQYGEGVYPVIKGYRWVPADPPPVQVREPSAPVKAAVRAPVTPAPTPKLKPRPRSALPSPQTLGYLRAEVNWLRQQPTETTVLFSLDGTGQVVGCTRIQGASDHCDIDLGHVLKEARSHAAVSVVMLHNHPHWSVR